MSFELVKTEPEDFVDGCNDLMDPEESIKQEELDLSIIDNHESEIKKEQTDFPEQDILTNFRAIGNLASTMPTNTVKEEENLVDLNEIPVSEENQNVFLETMVFKSCGRISDDETTPWAESSESDEGATVDEDDPDYCVESSSESSDSEESIAVPEDCSEDYKPPARKFVKKLSPQELKQDNQMTITNQSKVPSKDNPYPCPEDTCIQQFRSMSERRNHIKNDHGNSVSCPYNNCKSRLKSSTFDHHIKVIHEKLYPDILCASCGKFIVYMYESEHRERCGNDGTKKFHCSQQNCNASFSTVNGLGQHNRNSHKPRYDCPVEGCGTKVKPAYLSTHIKTVHEDCKRTCDKCGKVMSLHGLRRHLQICKNDGKKTFECTQEGCDERFLTSRYRSEHVRTVHAEPVKCSYEGCGLFFKPAYMNKHVQGAHKKIGGKRECRKCGKRISAAGIQKHEKKCSED